MPVIAIIGAGPGMGLAIARMFGTQGFKVALLSRNPGKHHDIIGALAKEGIEAEAFETNVLDAASIGAGLAAAKKRFGSIDVLEYSPSDPTISVTPLLQLSRESIQAAIDFYLYGALAAVQAVLPDMQAQGSGTILITTGASSVFPHFANDTFANVAVATAALRAYVHALHVALAPTGVQVGHVAIGAWIGKQPGATPEAIAPLYWNLHTERDQVEKTFFVDNATS